MTLDEADDIMLKVLELKDLSCSCHINPPCSKCVEMPLEEEIEEARKILEDSK